MIRLPPTDIGISQNDMTFHLQQLDIYQALLKQGFRKEEIAEYLRKEKINKQTARTTSLLPEPRPAPSTISLFGKAVDRPVPTSTDPLACDESSEDVAYRSSSEANPSTDEQSDRTSSEESATLPSFKHDLCPHIRYQGVRDKPHVPRQSSLLRFARRVSSDTSPKENQNIRMPVSARPITYRPRSETYSYDQSVVDEEELEESQTSLVISDRLEHLALDDELVPITAPVLTSIRADSHLRPEAAIFTPLQVQSTRTVRLSDKDDPESEDDSDHRSLPSSPPDVLSYSLDAHEPRLPSLPATATTPTPRASAVPRTARQEHLLHQQYLDGSFNVYDDSLPSSIQPQTPADLDRRHQFNSLNAAYTAPPGVVRSGGQHQTSRQVSGGQSPTIRAMLIRERRHREFVRSARAESLRISRARGGADGGLNVDDDGQRNGRPRDELDDNFWRADLNADAVGEENFDDGTSAADFQARMRVMSGNRRLT